MDWYNKTADDVLREQNTDAALGLVQANARHRLERYGSNTLPDCRPLPIWRRMLPQCRDAAVIIPLLGAIFAALAGAWAAACLFFLAAAARVALGLPGEDCGLRPPVLPPDSRAWVVRQGRGERLAVAELVPGDIVRIEEGDIIPADLRLLQSSHLQMDESALTGGAQTAYKDAALVFNGSVELTRRANMAYMGSVAVSGRGQGVVVATGANTELGHMAAGARSAGLQEGPWGGVLRALGLGVSVLCAVGWLLILIFSLIRQQGGEIPGRLADFTAAALPAALAPAILLVLELGLGRMREKGALLRRPAAAERLGAVNVLCVDKTGTLTKNEMTATVLWSAGRVTTVEGIAAAGAFRDSDGGNVDVLSRRDLIITLTGAALCNNAGLKESAVDTWTAVGDPTEGALLQLAFQAGLQKDALDEAFPRLAELPFDARRRMMTTIHRGYKRPIGYTKGAPDAVLPHCTEFERGGRRSPMTPQLRRRILEVNRLMAGQCLRVLAVAYREYTAIAADAEPESLEEELVFAGLIGILDPLRADAREAVAAGRAAGLRTVLVTGDSRDTAAAVARSLGLMEEGEAVLTGAELDLLSDGALKGAVKTANVYARVTPQHKLRIVEALQKNGDTVAFVGESVSDVQALRRADVGVGKGKSGTQIARSAADLELADDSYATLTAAAAAGRTLAGNTRRLTRFLLGANAAAALVMLAAAVAGFTPPFGALPLLILQLLLLLPPALALGTQAREKEKHHTREHIRPALNGVLALAAGVQGLLTAAAVLIVYLTAQNRAPAGVEPQGYANVLAYALLLTASLLAGFSSRREGVPLWQPAAGALRLGLAALIPLVLFAGALFIAPLREALGFVQLSVTDWLTVLGFALLLTALMEAYKLFLQPILERAVPGLQKGPQPVRPARRIVGRSSQNGRGGRRRMVSLSFSGSDPTIEDELGRETEDFEMVEPEELPAPLNQERQTPAPRPLSAEMEEELPEDEENIPAAEGSADTALPDTAFAVDKSTGEDYLEPLPRPAEPELELPLQPLRPLDARDLSAMIEAGADDDAELENINNGDDELEEAADASEPDEE